jgi:hypothetical protein
MINASESARGINAGDIESVARSLGMGNVTAGTLNEVRTEMAGRDGDPPASAPAIGSGTYYNSSSIVSAIESVANSMGMSINSSEMNQILGVAESAESSNAEVANLTAARVRQVIGTLEGISALSNVIGVNTTQFGGYSQMLGNVLNLTSDANLSSGQMAEIAGRLKNITSGLQILHVNASQALSVASNLNLTPGEASSAVVLLAHSREIEAASTFDREYHGMLNFVIAENGTLLLPFSVSGLEDLGGYVLAGNSSATFTFDGTITLGARAVPYASQALIPKGISSGILVIVPVTNSTCIVRVVGDGGALAIANVTAG